MSHPGGGVFASSAAGGQPNAALATSWLTFCTSPVTVSSGFRFPITGPGAVEIRANCNSWNSGGNYVDDTGGAFDPDLWECRVTVNSGPNPTSGPALNTWHQLNVNRQWIWSAAGQFNSGQWLIEVREIDDTGNNDSGLYNWSTEDGS